MGYRGRIIWPFYATIERLDTLQTSVNTVAGQPSGYDRVFREHVRTETEDARVYMEADSVKCQVSTELGPHDKLKQMPAGRDLEFDVRLTLHYFDLECDGLVNDDGTCVFQPSDRLTGIYLNDGETLRRDFSEAPLYCVHVQDRSWGLSGLERNLVHLYFKDRTEGAT